MEKKTTIDNNKKITHWTVNEYFQPGKWEWGVTSDHPITGKNNIWLLEALGIKNNLFFILLVRYYLTFDR